MLKSTTSLMRTACDPRLTIVVAHNSPFHVRVTSRRSLAAAVSPFARTTRLGLDLTRSSVKSGRAAAAAQSRCGDACHDDGGGEREGAHDRAAYRIAAARLASVTLPG